MITAQHVVNIVLDEATKLGRADETMVLVTDKVEATLRWAGNSMTTNGVSVSRSVTVISVVRRGSSARIGTVVSADWDAPVPGTGPLVFSDVADSLSRGFRGQDRLYGFAHHSVSTTFLGRPMIRAGDDAVGVPPACGRQSDAVGAPPACGGEWRR